MILGTPLLASEEVFTQWEKKQVELKMCKSKYKGKHQQVHKISLKCYKEVVSISIYEDNDVKNHVKKQWIDEKLNNDDLECTLFHQFKLCVMTFPVRRHDLLSMWCPIMGLDK